MVSVDALWFSLFLHIMLLSFVEISCRPCFYLPMKWNAGFVSIRTCSCSVFLTTYQTLLAQLSSNFYQLVCLVFILSADMCCWKFFVRILGVSLILCFSVVRLQMSCWLVTWFLKWCPDFLMSGRTSLHCTVMYWRWYFCTIEDWHARKKTLFLHLGRGVQSPSHIWSSTAPTV